MDVFYIEFSGDPSDDKECYKRYSSKNQPIKPIGNDTEVFELVEKSEYEKMKLAVVGLYNSIKLAPHVDSTQAVKYAEEVLNENTRLITSQAFVNTTHLELFEPSSEGEV